MAEFQFRRGVNAGGSRVCEGWQVSSLLFDQRCCGEAGNPRVICAIQYTLWTGLLHSNDVDAADAFDFLELGNDGL